MNLDSVKKILDEGEFSPEVQTAVRSIMDAATARGHVTEEEKTKLLGLIDLEVSAANIEADAMEEMASALDAFATETDEAIKSATADLKAADAELAAELRAITPDTVAA